MKYKSYKQIKAIEEKNKKRLLAVNKDLDNQSGIYFLTRTDENGIRYAYIGQAVKILQRLCSHLTGYQHIDLSLRKRGFYSEENPHGWRIGFLHFDKESLDEREQYYIKRYAQEGFQLLNKTSGSQGAGKEKIAEYRPQKGYHEGLEKGYENARKDVAHLFALHLDVSTKKGTIPQQKALQKFMDFINLGEDENE